ncbi:MAG: response regulator [Planctomycetota bacterium]
MRVPVCALILAASTAGDVVAQDLRTEAEARVAKAAPPSTAWFEARCELVEALLDCDVRGALAAARETAAAAATQQPAIRAAMAAQVAMAQSLLEGSAAAEEAVRTAEVPPGAGSEPLWRCYYHLARARQLSVADHDADELAAAIEGAAAARDSGRPVLLARASLILHQLCPDFFVEGTQTALDVARVTIDTHHLENLRVWLLACDFVQVDERDNQAEVDRVLVRMEQLAVAQGHRRGQGVVALRRGLLALQRGDHDAAVRWLRASRLPAQELGDIRQLAHTIEFEADVEVDRDRLEQAQALIAEDHALIDGRGLPECERGIMETSFQLAIKRGDSPRIAELAQRLDQARRSGRSQWPLYLAVRDRLVRAEAERVSTHEQLQQAHLREQRHAWLAWLIGASVVAAAGVALTVLTWRSRRAALRTATRLREQMERLTAEQAARARAEERIRQLELSDSLGVLANGIAHDFNNLLTCVLGYAEELQEEAAGAEHRQLASTIASAARQGARMCRQLQAYAGATPTDATLLDLPALIAEVIPVLAGAVRDRLTVRPGTLEPGTSIVADRSQIEQVLLNLAINAADAAAHTVTVGTHVVRLTADAVRDEGIRGELQPGRFAVLDVEDDGDGLDPQMAARVFDPFFTTKFPGRGLGLAVVYGVLRRHGGGVRLDTAQGAGARFRLFFPLAEPAAVGTPDPLPISDRDDEAEPTTTKPATVVVVDDETAIRDLLRVALRRAGHEVVATDNGADVERILGERAATESTVLLLDLTMPAMDGPEVFRRVRAAFPLVPVVLMSGHARPHVDDVARELRPDGVLLKPFDLATARRAVAAVLP